MTKYAYDLAIKQARGETEPVPVETGKLTGALAVYKEMRWNPVKTLGFSAAEASAKITVPALFVVAEKEELANNDTVRARAEGPRKARRALIPLHHQGHHPLRCLCPSLR